MKINLSFTYDGLVLLRSQIDTLLSDKSYVAPYMISFDVPKVSVSGTFSDPFSGTDTFKHWDD